MSTLSSITGLQFYSPTLSEAIKSPNDIVGKRQGFSCCVSENKTQLFVFGGCDEESGTESHDLFSFELKGAWSKLAVVGSSVPTGRLGASFACVGGNLYLFGGCCSTKGWLNDMWRYNLASHEWFEVKTSSGTPCPRDKTCMTAVGNKIMLYGGFGPNPTGSADLSGEMDLGQMEFIYFSDLWQFDIDSSSWNLVKFKRTSWTPVGLAAHGQCLLGKKLVLFGGKDASTGRRSNRLFIFDTETQKWLNSVPSEDAPEGRSFHGVCAVADRLMVVYGGRNADDDELDDFHLFDIVDNKWLEPLMDENSAVGVRHGHVMDCLVDDDGRKKLVLFGGSSGLDPESGAPGTVHNDLCVLDVEKIMQLL